MWYLFFFFLFFFFFFFFCFFGTVPTAYGGSQARGWIGAAATDLHHSHSHTESEPCLWPTPQLLAMLDRSATHWAEPGIELTSSGTSWILVRFVTCWATMGTPCLSLSDFLHSEWDSLVEYMLLQMASFCSFFYGRVVFHVYMYHIFLTCSSINGHLGCFCVLAIGTSAAVNIDLHVSFWMKVLSWYMPWSGIARSCDSFRGQVLKAVVNWIM